MIRADGPHDLQGLAGRKVGVLGGTTTEQALRLQRAEITADVILTKTHAEGVAMLDDGRISAYFADRDILTSLVSQSKEPTKLAVASNYLTIEPYALALPHGDEDFRLAVDRALSHIYRGEIKCRSSSRTSRRRRKARSCQWLLRDLRFAGLANPSASDM